MREFWSYLKIEVVSSFSIWGILGRSSIFLIPWLYALTFTHQTIGWLFFLCLSLWFIINSMIVRKHNIRINKDRLAYQLFDKKIVLGVRIIVDFGYFLFFSLVSLILITSEHIAATKSFKYYSPLTYIQLIWVALSVYFLSYLFTIPAKLTILKYSNYALALFFNLVITGIIIGCIFNGGYSLMDNSVLKHFILSNFDALSWIPGFNLLLTTSTFNPSYFKSPNFMPFISISIYSIIIFIAIYPKLSYLHKKFLLNF